MPDQPLLAVGHPDPAVVQFDVRDGNAPVQGGQQRHHGGHRDQGDAPTSGTGQRLLDRSHRLAEHHLDQASSTGPKIRAICWRISPSDAGTIG